MQRNAETIIQINRKMIVSRIVTPLLLGLLALLNILGDPRTEVIRRLDMVRLVGVGLCWGVAIAGIVLVIRSKTPEA